MNLKETVRPYKNFIVVLSTVLAVTLIATLVYMATTARSRDISSDAGERNARLDKVNNANKDKPRATSTPSITRKPTNMPTPTANPRVNAEEALNQVEEIMKELENTNAKLPDLDSTDFE
jgi:hypothetical protein